MRILHLTPGTGSFHCGSCLRDHALMMALRQRGHEVLMAPLYLPLVTEHDTEAEVQTPLMVGGVQLYLQERLPWLARLPAGLRRWLDHPALLRLAGRMASMTSARDLGRMTLGALMGPEGRQWPQWLAMLQWARDEIRPDVVSLSNGLLLGLCSTLRHEMKLPVVVSLQGEDAFVDGLPQPWRDQCWRAMRQQAAQASALVAASGWYAAQMQQRLELPSGAVRLVSNGLDLSAFGMARPDAAKPVIGYFARWIPGKGLTTMVEAYIALMQRGHFPTAQLKIGGSVTPAEDSYVAQLRAKLETAGLADRVQWHPNLSFEDKLAFFTDLSLFSVPATYGEAFGLYVIEAMAAAVPVVQPRHAAFPELIEATGGGLLCKPDDALDLALKWEQLLGNEPQRAGMALHGREAVLSRHSAQSMAAAMEAVLLEVREP